MADAHALSPDASGNTDSRDLKILIADDEPLAAERLQLLLARCDGVDLVGTASDGDSAVRMADALTPDLMLLDIAMPGLDGIEVARALAGRRPAPAIIFITAFDQFAVAAFEVAAVDRDYMRLHVAARSWLIHSSMNALEEGLDPALFIRLHRSAIVRRDFVTGFSRNASGRWIARLADGSEQPVGRLYADSVREMAGR
ncbi:MAG: response regulator transcription factor [Sphingomonadales bacterium]|nr:response regulator transcription factor [Sphingomonadales bacterium]